VTSAPLRLSGPHDDGDETRPVRSVWIYRYYDDAVRTFVTTPGDRQEIETSALGLADLIAHVKQSTGAPRVILVGHSTGGLIIRCLLQRVYPMQRTEPCKHVDKVFTYATPHGGIHFSRGPLGWGDDFLGNAVEAARDALGRLVKRSNIDDFGLGRMRRYLAADHDRLPDDWTPRDPPSTFPVERMFCLVGTNPVTTTPPSTSSAPAATASSRSRRRT
jgi:pimeloyl-ACP methyl ester carboxylesterase